MEIGMGILKKVVGIQICIDVHRCLDWDVSWRLDPMKKNRLTPWFECTNDISIPIEFQMFIVCPLESQVNLTKQVQLRPEIPVTSQ